jgi:hypothetical protein
MKLTSSRNLSPNFGLATATYLENFPLYDTSLAFAAACITYVTTTGSLSFSSVWSKYFLAASSDASEISCYTQTTTSLSTYRMDSD